MLFILLSALFIATTVFIHWCHFCVGIYTKQNSDISFYYGVTHFVLPFSNLMIQVFLRKKLRKCYKSSNWKKLYCLLCKCVTFLYIKMNRIFFKLLLLTENIGTFLEYRFKSLWGQSLKKDFQAFQVAKMCQISEAELRLSSIITQKLLQEQEEKSRIVGTTAIPLLPNLAQVDLKLLLAVQFMKLQQANLRNQISHSFTCLFFYSSTDIVLKESFLQL